MNENEISKVVVDSAFKVHKLLGPGLLESVYQAALFHEIRQTGLKVFREVGVPVEYDSVRLEIGFRADLIIEDLIIVEIKSVEKLIPVHKKQLLTYLKLTGLKLGILLNFNEVLLKNGITRIVNKL